MNSILSTVACEHLQRKATRYCSLTLGEIQTSFQSLTNPPDAPEAFINHLLNFSGYDISSLHDSIYIVPDSLRGPSPTGTGDFSLETLLEHHQGEWWMECIQSYLGIEPYYMNSSGAVFWSYDPATCLASSVAKFIEGVVAVDTVTTWDSPWYQMIENFDGKRLDEICLRIDVPEYTPASDEYRKYWIDSERIIRLARLPHDPQRALFMWGFARDLNYLKTLNQRLSEFRTQKTDAIYMDDVTVRQTYRRQE